MKTSLSLLNFLFQSVSPQAEAADCDMFASVLAETEESPFFEHYHQIRIPISDLIAPPEAGIEVITSPLEADAYHPTELDSFVKSSGLSKEALKVHAHPVRITKAQLVEIASGETVEVRVISKNGNFVHSINLKASPAVMIRIRKGKK